MTADVEGAAGATGVPGGRHGAWGRRVLSVLLGTGVLLTGWALAGSDRPAGRAAWLVLRDGVLTLAVAAGLFSAVAGLACALRAAGVPRRRAAAVAGPVPEGPGGADGPHGPHGPHRRSR
ncbi:hypothetical protein Kpho02_18890 [Kitasatospora phosalacinea]|uniref:Uncharacterized protein n=1 Tax=Kitasatospora phosalacinea TaxID=2065 RepID=A0A9W6V233_9ACTN|nr:hypothetical protein [Kitasatospora phosalacinea]GLW69590.1 hypothetical protein Kpho02_18890 [Kitasatospora phosalacinea]